MILTRGLGIGGGIVALGFGAWIGAAAPAARPVEVSYYTPSYARPEVYRARQEKDVAELMTILSVLIREGLL